MDSLAVDHRKKLVLDILAGQCKSNIDVRAMLSMPRWRVWAAFAVMNVVQVDDSARVVPSEDAEVPAVDLASDQGRELHEVETLDLDIFICNQRR